MLRLLLRALWPAFAVLVPIVAIAAPFAVIYSGVYDVAATRQHTTPVYWALITSLRQSIVRHAPQEIPAPPDLSAPERVDRGLRLYDMHCVPCHGGPGVPPAPMGLGLTPPPANLVLPGREWTAQELYWTVAKGLKMTGMPAWEFRLPDEDIWSIVAFMKVMPALSPSEYAHRRRQLTAHATENAR